MLEKPELSDEKIIACLQAQYAIHVTKLGFLPLGYDVTASVYQVETDNATYFLKIKSGNVQDTSITVPYFLKRRGIAQIVAPIATLSQSLWVSLDKYKLILYPFVIGQTGMDIGLSDEQWHEFGTILQQVHTAAVPDDLAKHIQKEQFIPPYADTVRHLDEHITSRTFNNRNAKTLADFWLEKRDEILKILPRTEALGHILQTQSLNFVLCHSDIHTANILIDENAGLHIVDWDGVQLAPKERDLMFITEKDAREQRLFFAGYGQTDINDTAIAYYRYEWVVQEFGDFGEQVFFMDDVGDETKANAVDEFKQLFAECDVVHRAYISEKELLE